jgi:2-polyprenyl-3-methyl-5-hydroxy-6-metoxy-1,4-benzoquinol methylase
VQLNLGCPNFCVNWVCVDLHPKDRGVIQSDAIEYLYKLSACNSHVDYIRAKNLIEHLPNVGEFFSACHKVLSKNGMLEIITDNAEFYPFYLPVIHRLGFAAHCSNKYSPSIMNGTKHYAVFTTLNTMLRTMILRYKKSAE